MTTLDAVKRNKPEPSAEERAAKELVRLAAEQGLSLTGPDGLLKQFTKTVLEIAIRLIHGGEAAAGVLRDLGLSRSTFYRRARELAVADS